MYRTKPSFPQADRFDVVVQILNLKDEAILSDSQKLCEELHLSSRQTAYYTAAAFYLGLLDDYKIHYSDKANQLRHLSEKAQEDELVKLLLSDGIIEQAYSLQNNISDFDKYDISDIIHEKYPRYSTESCDRRGQTVLQWIRWIHNHES